jgi:hypothetical protein
MDVPSASMPDEPLKAAPPAGIDWKAIGYLVSIVSVFFLGAIAWPKPTEPRWHIFALIVGMTTSIVGMGCRYKAHLDEQREIRKAKQEARRN